MSVSILNQLLAPTILLIFSVGFFSIWLSNQRWKSALYFTFSYFFCAVAFALVVFPLDRIISPNVGVISDMFFVLASILFVFGMSCHMKNRAGDRIAVALALIFAVMMVWYRYFEPDLFFRVRTITIAAGMLLGVAAFKVFIARKRTIDWALFGFAIILAICLGLATFITLDGRPPINREAFTTSLLLAFITLLVASVGLALALTIFFDFAQQFYGQLHRKTMTDELSGLLNRRGYEAGVAERMRRAEDTGEKCWLIICDIDRFKAINDTHGHAFGDEVIAEFGRLLRTSVRKDDLVGRIGGEEFCLFLAGAGAQRVIEIAEHIREEFQNNHLVGPTGPSAMTTSCGVANCRLGDDYSSLFRRADEALYRAKQGGRNRVEVAE